MNLREKRRYWKLKEGAVEGTLWRTGFGMGRRGRSNKQLLDDLRGKRRY
jgi:hypothetical protein